MRGSIYVDPQPDYAEGLVILAYGAVNKLLLLFTDSLAQGGEV